MLFKPVAENILRLDFENETLMKETFPFWELSISKNGLPVATENGLKLHSFYAPQKEAGTIISTVKKESSSIVFEGFGLGYAVISAAELFPQKNFVIVECEPAHFFASLALLDWESVFKIEKIVLAIGSSVEETVKLIRQNPILQTTFISVSSHQSHAKNFFSELQELIHRNKKREEINAATTKKFGSLWNRNCLRNAERSVLCEGVDIFENCARNLPFLVIAAGPSLQKILPHIDEISKKCITVAVDTALRSLLSVDFQPDFIILTDPQYYAYRHIAGLSAPKSILIASQDVYPSVFGFECKKILCSASLMPLGKFFENECGKKASLGSGGSVASCAWNFSRFCGSRKIFLIGLDLSFPMKQTHSRGSTFEQNAHSISYRLDSAENKGIPALLSGNTMSGEDYNGNIVLTDQRMKMFAWWFESRIAECNDTKTFTLSPEGLKISGVNTFSISALLNEKEIISEKKAFFKKAKNKYRTENEIRSLKEKYRNAKKLLDKKLKDVNPLDFDSVEKALEKHFSKIF